MVHQVSYEDATSWLEELKARPNRTPAMAEMIAYLEEGRRLKAGRD